MKRWTLNTLLNNLCSIAGAAQTSPRGLVPGREGTLIADTTVSIHAQFRDSMPTTGSQSQERVPAKDAYCADNRRKPRDTGRYKE